MEMFSHQVLLQNERMLMYLLLRKKRDKLAQVALRRMITWVLWSMVSQCFDSRSGLMPSTSSLETLAATPASPLRLDSRQDQTGQDLIQLLQTLLQQDPCQLLFPFLCL